MNGEWQQEELFKETKKERDSIYIYCLSDISRLYSPVSLAGNHKRTTVREIKSAIPTY